LEDIETADDADPEDDGVMIGVVRIRRNCKECKGFASVTLYNDKATGTFPALDVDDEETKLDVTVIDAGDVDEDLDSVDALVDALVSYDEATLAFFS
jgi:hypothetical protein